MPRLAFLPGPIAEVQGRSFRSLRPRQTRGLGAGVVLAASAGALLGWSSPAGMAATVAAALPGFMYGFLTIRGKPIEYWLQVALLYQFSPRRAVAARKGGTRRA